MLNNFDFNEEKEIKEKDKKRANIINLIIIILFIIFIIYEFMYDFEHVLNIIFLIKMTIDTLI